MECEKIAEKTRDVFVREIKRIDNTNNTLRLHFK